MRHPWTRSPAAVTTLLLVLAGLAGCSSPLGSPDAPEEAGATLHGSLAVRVEATGDIDRGTEFSCRLDIDFDGSVAAVDGELFIERVAAGAHTLELILPSGNSLCTVADNPRSVFVRGGETTTVVFAVDCTGLRE